MTSANNITFPDFPPDLTQQIARLGDRPFAGGGLADIWLCTYHHPLQGSRQVAVKSFRYFITQPTSTLRDVSLDVRRELEIWRRLNHPNVLPLLGISTGFNPFISIVSEWMPNGNLQYYLSQNDEKMTTDSRLQLLVDIASGLEYLHSLPVIHGDLIPTNILIDKGGNALLSGFGFATVPELIADRLPYLRADSDSRGAFTIRFMPPELLQEELVDVGTEVDIYFLGCNGLLVLSGQMPWSEFRGPASIMLRLEQGEFPPRPDSRPIDDRYWEFLRRCLSSARDRPSAQDAFLTFYSFLTSLVE